MTTNLPQIQIDQQVFDVESLDQFGFSARFNLPEAGLAKGTLRLVDQLLKVQFRVRDNSDGLCRCSFANMPIANLEKLQHYLVQRDRGFLKSELESRSYDELAAGMVGEPNNPPPVSKDDQLTTEQGSAGVKRDPNSGVASAQDRTDAVPVTTQPSAAVAQPSPTADDGAENAASGGVKSLVMLVMLFGLIGLAALAVYFLKSRSTLSVGNSALVGNYLPINVKADGEIVEVLVNEGDFVEKGDVLLRLKNPMMEMERKHCLARLQTAQSKVKALTKQLRSFDKKLEVAAKKLKLDREVAVSEAISAEKLKLAAKSNVARLKSAFAKQAISQAEYDVAENEYLAAEAASVTANSVVKQVEFSQDSVKDKVLILGDRFDDEASRLLADLEIAQAEEIEMQLALDVAQNQFEELSVTAPRSGKVYVTYRQVGEFVKIADETVGLSFDGKVWAAGQVSASQARRVRPGQPVTVTAPSMGKRFEGVVIAVGHRALYSHGRYTADFRGETATDVPVKVMINDLSEDVPSGIRLEMAINTGFGVEWLDNAMGYKLKPVSDALAPPQNAIDSDATNQDVTAPRTPEKTAVAPKLDNSGIVVGTVAVTK
jgi:membrane fusion protein (multidrug efflux system)